MSPLNVKQQIDALAQALDAGDHGAVKVVIDGLRTAAPGSPQVLRLAGTALFRLNQMAEASAYLAAPALAKLVDVQEMLLTAAKAAGDWGLARGAARRAALLAPANPEFLRDNGVLSYQPGQLRQIFGTSPRLACLNPAAGTVATILVDLLSMTSAQRYDMCALEEADLLSRLALISGPADVAQLMMHAEISTDRFDPVAAAKSSTRAHLVARGRETDYPELIVLSTTLELFKMPVGQPLGVKVLAGGSLIPCHVDPNAGGIRAGVFDANGQAHNDALLRWNNKRLVHPATTNAPVETLQGEVIFGGFLLHQYGHFVLETLARYWYIWRNPEIPVIFSGPVNLSATASTKIGFLEWEERILDFLGIGADRRYLGLDPVRIEKLHLPDAGLILRDTFYGEQAEALGRFQTKPTRAGKNVWLSRAGKGVGDIENERGIEIALADAGWTIGCLHEMGFLDQLDLLGDCERIAGFAASAFHTLVFLDQVQARVDIFSRNNRRFQTAETIAEVKGFDQEVHYPRMIKSAASSLGSRFHAEDPSEIIRTLLS
jgi:hypothetical protein